MSLVLHMVKISRCDEVNKSLTLIGRETAEHADDSLLKVIWRGSADFPCVLLLINLWQVFVRLF